METMSSHYFLSYAKPDSLSPKLQIFPPKTTFFAGSSTVSFPGYNCFPRKLKFGARELRNFVAIRASDSKTTDASTNASATSTWLLQPNVVTIGRVREKADIVIPVPTVSGLHARIQKSEENLLVTDLDSTNGTFVNEKRLIPGVVFPASPGNLITFGDTNLAIFRVYKVPKEELSSEAEAEIVSNINLEPTA